MRYNHSTIDARSLRLPSWAPLRRPLVPCKAFDRTLAKSRFVAIGSSRLCSHWDLEAHGDLPETRDSPPEKPEAGLGFQSVVTRPGCEDVTTPALPQPSPKEDPVMKRPRSFIASFAFLISLTLVAPVIPNA